MYEPQEGTWTLIAPDGRKWTGASGLLAAAAEQRERIPPEVQLERIFAELEPTEDEKDAARYRWLRGRDLDAIVEGGIFAGMVPDNLVVNGEDLDREIDAAMSKTQNDQAQGAGGSLIAGGSPGATGSAA